MLTFTAEPLGTKCQTPCLCLLYFFFSAGVRLGGSLLGAAGSPPSPPSPTVGEERDLAVASAQDSALVSPSTISFIILKRQSPCALPALPPPCFISRYPMLCLFGPS